ncbi:MAG: hypothetical protein R6V62_08285 [Candidatus Fermentibacteraceae bacterium]
MENIMGILPFLIIMGLYSVLSIIFAFVKPPSFLNSIFKVPGIFVFLPDNLVLPVGRVFAGLLGIGLIVFLVIRLSSIPG